MNQLDLNQLELRAMAKTLHFGQAHGRMLRHNWASWMKPKRKDFETGQLIRVLGLAGWKDCVGRVLRREHRHENHLVRVQMLTGSPKPQDIWVSAELLERLEGLELLAWSWEDPCNP